MTIGKMAKGQLVAREIASAWETGAREGQAEVATW